MKIRSFYLNPEGQIERDLDAERLREARGDKKGLLWLDVFDPDFESTEFLINEMAFHPLAVDDAMSRAHQPAKVDDYQSHLFMVVHGIDYTSEEEFVETARLSMFVAEGTVVTLHRVELISVDAVIDRIKRDVRLMERPASLFSYTILDSLHDAILPALNHLGEVAAGLEEISIDAPGKAVLQRILQLKRSSIRVQRIMAPQIRVFNRLSRNEFPIIEEQASMYFRDLQDQVIQLDVINQGVRDTADNALATYLSSIGIKQNETMRVLAIVAAVFLPLSLLAGIYGMNFEYMPDLGFRWGYFIVLGVMLTVGLATFYWLFIRQFVGDIRKRAEMMMDVKPTVDQVQRMTSPVGSVVDMTDVMTRNITGAVTGTVGNVRGTVGNVVRGVRDRKPR